MAAGENYVLFIMFYVLVYFYFFLFLFVSILCLFVCFFANREQAHYDLVCISGLG